MAVTVNPNTKLVTVTEEFRPPVKLNLLPSHTHTKADITDFAHTHNYDEIAGLEAELDLKQDAEDAFSGSYLNLTNVPATFPPATHVHAIEDVEDLDEELEGKADAVHVHAAEDITSGTLDAARLPELGLSDIEGLEDALDDKLDAEDAFSGSYEDLEDIPEVFAPDDHSHAIEDVTDLQTALDGKVGLTGDEAIAGIKNFTGSATTFGGNGVVRSTSQAGSMIFSGGSSAGNGGSIVLYGSTHASNANRGLLRIGSSSVFVWNADSLIANVPITGTVTFDNTESSLTADTVKDAIDELASDVSDLEDTTVKLTGNQTVAGIKQFTSDLVVGTVRNQGGSSQTNVSGGTSSGNGANIVLYGQTAGGNANTGRLRVGTSTVAEWNDSGLTTTVTYDNTDSGLTATTVKGAIDELASAGGSAPDVVNVTGNYAVTSADNGKVLWVDIPSVSYIGSATGTTTATIPAHIAGDLLVAFAYRDGNTTAPTLPSGWTSLNNSGADTNSGRLAWRVATDSATTSGTWTNATSLVIHVYRHAAIGAHAVGGASSTTVTYPALSLTQLDGSSWVAGFAGHRSTNTSLETPPAGMVNRSTVVDATDEAAGHDSNGGVAAWGATAVSVGGTASGWRAYSLELVYSPVTLSIPDDLATDTQVVVLAKGSVGLDFEGSVFPGGLDRIDGGPAGLVAATFLMKGGVWQVTSGAQAAPKARVMNVSSALTLNASHDGAIVQLAAGATVDFADNIPSGWTVDVIRMGASPGLIYRSTGHTLYGVGNESTPGDAPFWSIQTQYRAVSVYAQGNNSFVVIGDIETV